MTYKDESVKINKKNVRKRLKALNHLEPGFAAPDGGWGWMIVVASGFTNVFSVALIMSFGLIFRDNFKQLGINASQTTTLLNINSAIAAIVGLANGPLFRKYSYRQAACVGGFVCGISICALSFMKTFYGVLIFFSILYATGKSIAMSACSLTLITYFKKKRRLAVGLFWACSGIGSIVSPQLSTMLMLVYGMSGTILIYGGLAFNIIVCALLLQPVGMHAKRDTGYETIDTAAKEYNEDTSNRGINESGKTLSMEIVKRRDKHATLVDERSSQHNETQCLYYDDEENGPVDVIKLRTSMIPRDNDDWRSNEVEKQIAVNAVNPTEQLVTTSHEYTDNDKEQKNDGCGKLDDSHDTTGYLPRKSSTMTRQEVEKLEQTKRPRFNQAFHEFAAFFDLNLLRDCVFVNLIMGVGFAIFAELNFILLTPYILLDYGLKHTEVATIMSVLAGVDLLSRVMVSFLTTRIGWNNRTFFLIGIGFAAVGRAVLAHVTTYSMLMAVAILLGIGKGLTLVFSTLVIPGHVSQEELPGAVGLQLVTRGIIFLMLGPIVGWVRDTCGNYMIMLHFLNFFSYLVIISWIFENWCCSRKEQLQEEKKCLRV